MLRRFVKKEISLENSKKRGRRCQLKNVKPKRMIGRKLKGMQIRSFIECVLGEKVVKQE